MEDSQFSGPAAFWCLPPLAFNIMLQPSGRPCGFHFRCRTYLRAIPLVCAADAISIWIRFITNWILAGVPWRQAATLVLECRYRCCDYCEGSESPEESLQDLERNAYLRWIAFFYATFPAALKVFAVSGIPWTTAWAAMYLSLWITVEVLLLAADKHPASPSPRDLSRTPQSVEAARLSLVKTLERKWAKMHMSLGLVAAGVHQILLWFIFIKIWETNYDETVTIGSITSGPIHGNLPFPMFLYPVMTIVAMWMAVIVVALGYLVRSPLREDREQRITVAAFFPTFYPIFISYVARIEFPTWFIVFTALPVTVYLFLWLESVAWCRRIVFFLPPRRRGSNSERKVESEALMSLVYVLMTTNTAVFYYFFGYDAEGTSKPIWLKWLG